MNTSGNDMVASEIEAKAEEIYLAAMSRYATTSIWRRIWADPGMRASYIEQATIALTQTRSEGE